MLDETFREVVERLESLGFYNFSLTGGEPLLHPKYFDFIRFLNRKGLYTNSPTNGTLLNEKNVMKLKEVGLDSIFVSIDSLDSKIADHIRQHPGQLNKALKGLKLLKKYGISRAAILVLSKYNTV
jgi:pyrroloquinoline quinone biosynthesis protein E